jgi:hypothetical protein
MKLKNLAALVAATLAAVAGATMFVKPQPASAFPQWCQQYQVCVDASMQPLDGAGLDARAWWQFYRHDAAGATFILPKVRVANYGGGPCSYKVQAKTVAGDVTGPPSGTWPCDETHNLGWQVSSWDGVVYVWVYRSPDLYTYHSLSLDDFCTVSCWQGTL